MSHSSIKENPGAFPEIQAVELLLCLLWAEGVRSRVRDVPLCQLCFLLSPEAKPGALALLQAWHSCMRVGSVCVCVGAPRTGHLLLKTELYQVRGVPRRVISDQCGARGRETCVPGAETCPAVGLGGLEVFAVADTHLPASEAGNRILSGAVLCWAELIFCWRVGEQQKGGWLLAAAPEGSPFP